MKQLCLRLCLLLVFCCGFISQLKADIGSDTLAIKSLSDRVWELMSYNLPRARKAALEALQRAEKLGNAYWIANSYNDLGTVEQVGGHFRQAIPFHKKALAIRRKIGHPYGIGSSLSKLGNCYVELQEPQKALDCHLQALVFLRKINNKRSIAYTLNNLCAVYLDLRDYSYMGEFAEESYRLTKELNDTLGMANSLGYLSSASQAKGEEEKALGYEKEAYLLSALVKDTSMMSSLLNNIGYSLTRLNRPAEAMEAYQKAVDLNLNWSRPDTNGLILYLANLANRQREAGIFRKALQNLQKARRLALESNLPKHLSQVYKTLADLFLQTGQPDSALLYMDLYKEAYEKQFSSEIAQQVGRVQNQYEIAIREQEKARLKQENELQNQRIRQLQLSWGALFLLLISLVLGFWLWRSRQKNRETLQQKEAEIKSREAQTQAMLEGEELERKRIARELHDGVGQQLSAARLQISGLEDALGENGNEPVKKSLYLLDQAVREVRSVAHAMLAQSVQTKGLKSALEDFTAGIHRPGVLDVELHLDDVEIPEQPELMHAIFRMVQELASNVIRHAGARHLSIQVMRQEDAILLMAEDDGKGFVPGAMEEGAGFRNLRNRLAPFKGQMHIDSQPGKGCTVTIEIPV